MHPLGLFFLAMGMGFLVAIPIGAGQVEAAKRAIHGHLGAGLMVALGSVSSDVIYGLVAMFGLAPFLRVHAVMAAFNAAGAVVLWFIAYRTLRESKKPPEVRLSGAGLRSWRWAYVTGFTLAFTNPPMILTWLYGAALAHQLGLVSQFTTAAKLTFVAGGVLGLGTYFGGLTLFIYRVKHFIPVKALGKVYYWLGIALFVLSFFFVYQAVKLFFNWPK
jgi:threonine/homoserine/homoserine lactone efflux protein